MKRLVLLGGGSAHLHVLRAFAREAPAGAEVLLISAHARQLHAAMLPGLVAGRCTADDCAVPLAPLAEAGHARFERATATAIDTAARRVRLADGRVAEYDVLSLALGAVQDRDAIPGAREHGLFVRPVERFVQLHEGLLALAATRLLDIVVIGGGATAVELAMAWWQRLARREERVRIALVTGGAPLLAGHPAPLRERALEALARRRITVVAQAAVRIDERAVHLANGARLACDAPVLATGPHPPAFLADGALARDERGFVATGPTLQSPSHSEVFAAGGIAGAADTLGPRTGELLALNLRRHVAGGELLPLAPPAPAASLIACGDGRAIAARGRWAGQGLWAGWWKDRQDRGFVARHRVTSAGT